MGFVLSPSNMMTFKTCPLKFYGQSIAKDILYKESPAKQRGIEVHEAVENYIVGASTSLPSDIDAAYTRRMIDSLGELGGVVHVEKELAITKELEPTTFWADNAWLRARADVVVEHNGSVTLIDLKTGKKWDNDNFQLRVEAMMCVPIFKVQRVNFAYWYLDAGETVAGTVDLSDGLRQVSDIIKLSRDMETSIANGSFAPRRNKFCRWCDYYKVKC